jgi:hypothetical protein
MSALGIYHFQNYFYFSVGALLISMLMRVCIMLSGVLFLHFSFPADIAAINILPKDRTQSKSVKKLYGKKNKNYSLGTSPQFILLLFNAT